MKKIIIILSGGMDSTTLLYDWVRLSKDCNNNPSDFIQALSFDYGQRHKKELEYAKKTCKKLNIKHQIIDITNLTNLISNSSLTSNIEVPEGHYEDECMKKTVVPNRNMIMASIAIGYAENLGFDGISIANHAGDHAIYPDCRKEFILALETASYIGTYNHIKIYDLYSEKTKIDIARIGLKLGIDYENDTWSCYKGLDKPCNKCGTCIERIEAIEQAKKL